jgi:hypothetical protein
LVYAVDVDRQRVSAGRVVDRRKVKHSLAGGGRAELLLESCS